LLGPHNVALGRKGLILPCCWKQFRAISSIAKFGKGFNLQEKATSIGAKRLHQVLISTMKQFWDSE
jgi:hypothetical protein